MWERIVLKFINVEKNKRRKYWKFSFDIGQIFDIPHDIVMYGILSVSDFWLSHGQAATYKSLLMFSKLVNGRALLGWNVIINSGRAQCCCLAWRWDEGGQVRERDCATNTVMKLCICEYSVPPPVAK